MSDEIADVFGSAPDGQTGSTGAVDTAKAEAADVKDTAVDKAKDVAETAKDEAGAVLDETKASLTDVYHQVRRELGDQAAAQQERLSSGMRDASDDLQQMAQSSGTSSVATDLVQRASQQLDNASTWLAQRDPADVVREVKSFARRRPGVFILGALLAGIAVGRLTRALATNAADDDSQRSRPARTAGPTRRQRPSDPSRGGAGGSAALSSRPGSDAEDAEDAPLYAETATRWSVDREGGTDERPDPV